MIGRSPTSKTFSSKRFTLCCDLTIPRIPLAVLTSYKSGYLYGDDKDGLEEKSDGVARRQPEEDSENVWNQENSANIDRETTHWTLFAD